MEGLDRVPLVRLRQYPFLASLPDVILQKLQPNLTERSYAAGELILRMGDYNDAAYYVRDGIAEVRLTAEPPASIAAARPVRQSARRGVLERLFPARRATSSPPGVRARAAAVVLLGDLPGHAGTDARISLGAGEIFGEMGALSRYPVSADVVAASALVCLVIRTPALRLMLKQRELQSFRSFVDERYRARTLASHLGRAEIFEGVDVPAIERLRRSAELMPFDPGALIVEQGRLDDGFYLVRGGYVKVSVQAGAADVAVTYLRKGDSVGEVSLLTDQPWPVSLRALEHVEMVRIAHGDLLEVLAAHPEVERRMREIAMRRLEERRLALERPSGTRYLQMAMDTGLINGESVLLIDLETCTRCDDCVTACSDAHDGTPRFVREGTRHGRWSVPLACYQCTDPVCMIGCPTGAITRPLGSLEVTIDRDTCIGCHNCVHRCPWGNIIEVPYRSPTTGHTIDLATKCDLCVGRTGGPACVEACPHGSAIRISFRDLERVVSTLSR
jgi:CRP-like cAMP-binding protein/Fe-S-cluster-containing dehydrogenase component